MLTNARKKAIENMAIKDGEVTISKAAEELGVSIETIRRDINALCRENVLTKVHGGAIPTTSILAEANYRQRKASNTKEKHLIGRAAQKFIFPKQVVSFSTGSTVEAVASNIHQKNIMVLTNSLPVCEILSELENSGDFDGKISLFGGLLNTKEHFSFGSNVAEQISNYHSDVVFVGATGICKTGLMCTDPEEGDIAAKMLAYASQVILVVESKKIGKPSIYRFADLDIVDIIITDSKHPISEEMLKLFEENNIKVVIAN